MKSFAMKKKRSLPKVPNAVTEMKNLQALTKTKCIEKQNSAENDKVLKHHVSVAGEKSSPTTKHRRLSRAVKKLVGNTDGSIEQTTMPDTEPPDLFDDLSGVFLPESPLMSPHHWSDQRSASEEILEILQSHGTEDDDELRGYLVSEEELRTKPPYLSDILETSMDCDFKHTVVDHSNSFEKKQTEKRNSVALLVDKFEKQKKPSAEPAAPKPKTKLHRLSHVPDTSPLASISLPPSLYYQLTHNSDDDEVASYMKANSTSNIHQISSEEEYFVPSGFSTKNSLTILNKQITRRKEGQLEGNEVTLSDSGLPHKNKRKKRSIYQDKSNSLSAATARRYSLGRTMSLDPCRTRTKTLNSETEHSGQSSLFGPKLKAGALASLLKNKKAEDQFKSVSTECLATVPVIETRTRGIGERQRSQSAEHSHRFVCCSKSAPTENTAHSPARVSCPEQSPTIRFPPLDLPPAHRQSPAGQSPTVGPPAFQRSPAFPSAKSLSPPQYQGFRSIAPAERSQRTSVVKPVLTPIPFQLDQRYQQLEATVEDIVSKMRCLSTRPSYRVNTLRRYSRPNYNKRLRKRLHYVESQVQSINTQLRWYRASREGSLDDVLTRLDLMHIKSTLESEDIGLAEFYLLTKRDMRELGLTVGVRRRILCYITRS